jgi:hypothetical protein
MVIISQIYSLQAIHNSCQNIWKRLFLMKCSSWSERSNLNQHELDISWVFENNSLVSVKVICKIVWTILQTAKKNYSCSFLERKFYWSYFQRVWIIFKILNQEKAHLDYCYLYHPCSLEREQNNFLPPYFQLHNSNNNKS